MDYSHNLRRCQTFLYSIKIFAVNWMLSDMSLEPPALTHASAKLARCCPKINPIDVHEAAQHICSPNLTDKYWL